MPEVLRVPTTTGKALADDEYVPPGMIVWHLDKTDRARRCHDMEAFFEGRQHDHHIADWDGRPRTKGEAYIRERYRQQGYVASNAAPYGARKPDAHFPLALQIVTRFTEMLFGHGRHPLLSTPADLDTQRFLRQVMETCEGWDVIMEARDIAGRARLSYVVLGVFEGAPTMEPLHPADVWVREWRAGPGWIPSLVIEQRLIVKDVPGPKGVESHRFWRTRVWDETHATVYRDVPEDWGETKESQDDAGNPLPIPVESALPHEAGRCPVVLFQNTRSGKSAEGREDCFGAYHLLDKIDRTASGTCQTTIANTSPTVVRADDPMYSRRRPIVNKGFGALIDVTDKGKVSYLETSGTSSQMGWTGVSNLRQEILQTTCCVIVTPENASTYQSGEALHVLWRSMESRCNRLRVPLGTAIKQVGEIWITLGQNLGVSSVEDEEPDGIVLPPWIEKPDELEPEGTEQVPDAIINPHKVGKARHVDITWPPYHAPTPAQLQALATALSVATGQKQTLSQRSAIEFIVSFLGRDDSADEWRRILDEKKRNVEDFGEAMFGGDGEDEDEDEGEDEDEDGDDDGPKPPATNNQGKGEADEE